MANLLDIPVLIPEAVLFPIGLSQAMESIAQTQRQMAQVVENFILPIRQIQEEIVSMMEPLRLVQQMLENSPMLKMIEDMQEANKQIAQLMTIRPIIPYFGFIDIIDGEIKEEARVVRTNIQTVVAPQPTMLPIPVISLPTKRVWGKMGLKQISGGNFSYKRITLKGISLRNREGQVLGFILANSDLFISDEIMLEKLYAKDTFARSKLMQLLKDKFRENGLQAVIERQGYGYILISIHYLQ